MPIASSALEIDSYLRILVVGPPKVGKAERVDEPVLTPTGWRAIGSLAVGDIVVGSNGKPTTVTAVFPQGRKRLVRFTSDDDASVLCSEDHLWLTTTRKELDRGRYYRPRIAGQTIRPHIPTGRLGAGSVKTARDVMLSIQEQHFLPRLSAPAIFRSEGRLTIDPYLLGLLLGDGSLTAGGISFHKPDEELLQTIVELAQAVGDKATRGQTEGRCQYVRICHGAIRNALEGLKLIGTFSHTKFVPSSFLFANPASRLAILQGLCDTDGYAILRDVRDEQHVTQAEFSTTSPRLRDDVLFIARSLGARARAIEVQPTYTYKDEQLDGKTAWRIAISFDDQTCPFRLKRKAENWPLERERTRVKSVEPAGEDECVCIAVDAPDHLFVTKDFLVTHNTSVSICTSPSPVRVILAERDSALRDAKRRGGKFDFERIRGDRPYEQMTTYLAQAKEDAKAGSIKTVVIDPLSEFAEKLLAQSMRLNLTSNQEEDGRAAYPHYSKRLLHVLDLACTIPAHLIVVSHFVEMGGGELPTQAKKSGDGIVPLIPGKIRLRVGGCFDDIVWFDLDKQDPNKRAFYTGPQGQWGPGCRSLSKTAVLPANFTALIKTIAEGLPEKVEKANGAPKPLSVKPPMQPTHKPTQVRR
jgi:hypothetical protein